ncbi:DUF3093 family protein [Mesorhizobium sp. PAMC28654]|nr:DUF3093 family protein [Mesorhizobium sp. PAMC28654]
MVAGLRLSIYATVFAAASSIAVLASLRTRLAVSDASLEVTPASLPASVVYSNVAFCRKVAKMSKASLNSAPSIRSPASFTSCS